MYDRDDQRWSSSRPYYQYPQPPAEPQPDPGRGRGGGGGGVSRRAVALIAAIVLFFGVIGGGVVGGVIGYALNESDDDGGAVATATPSGERGVAATATPTTEGAETVAQTNQPGEETPAEEPAAQDAPGSNVTPADIFEQVSPAVVTIINEQQFAGGFFGPEGIMPAGAGTGFIISEDGYIVTNNHVVEGSQQLRVIFSDGTAVAGELVGTDRRTDLAVIKVDVEVPAVVPLGDSDALRPGEPIVAIGSALGDYTNTITTGVISGLGRQLDDLDNLIQHDAAINPGNSGGPLLNMRGEVVGVNTAVIRNAGTGITAEGMAFAVPSNTVRDVVDQIINTGQVVRPFLGISFQILTPSLAAAEDLPIDYGAIVMEITPGGPVANSGIQVDDIITKLNGEEITQNRSLQTILFQYAPGDTIDVEVYRPSSGETLTFQVTLGERPADLDG